MIECVFCKTKSVKKSIMSPNISNINEPTFPNKKIKKIKKDLVKLRKFIEKNFDYVGDNFPREVRKINYDKNKKKNIYGTATLDETNELKEEGINLTTIPWVKDKDN